ncbi:MAG: c-type cytochrome [Candidatus Kryptoniota bacterium]
MKSILFPLSLIILVEAFSHINNLVILKPGAATPPYAVIGNDRKTHYSSSEIARGRYLVELGGCNDCHTPKIFTKNGPVPDTSKLLSGAPENESVPTIPPDVLGQRRWGMLGTNDGTIFAGPWGVSFASNLTPDSATGIGGWTEKMFVQALRTGRYWGNGRPLLPPMPWQGLAKLSDRDIKAIYAYLRSIKPVHNLVHSPIPPGK